MGSYFFMQQRHPHLPNTLYAVVRLIIKLTLFSLSPPLGAEAPPTIILIYCHILQTVPLSEICAYYLHILQDVLFFSVHYTCRKSLYMGHIPIL